MDEVEFHCEPPTNVPTLVVAFGGWVDAGEAATGAMRYLSARTKIFLYVKILPTFTDPQLSLVSPTAHQEGRADRCDLFKI